VCIERKKERREGKQKECEVKTSSRERKRYTERQTKRAGERERVR